MEVDKDTIKRAWGSEKYRKSLPADVRAAIPSPPDDLGPPELTDDELKTIAGGSSETAD